MPTDQILSPKIGSGLIVRTFLQAMDFIFSLHLRKGFIAMK